MNEQLLLSKSEITKDGDKIAGDEIEYCDYGAMHVHDKVATIKLSGISAETVFCSVLHKQKGG